MIAQENLNTVMLKENTQNELHITCFVKAGEVWYLEDIKIDENSDMENADWTKMTRHVNV